jgi:multisubunit Na+/H+ antiporter MnhF subunit
VSPLSLTLDICVAGLSLGIFLSLERMRRGPTLMDRILAFDTICVMIVGMMALLSIRWSSSDYLDLILIFTLLGFLSAVALCLYLHRAYTPHGPAMKSEKIRRKK